MLKWSCVERHKESGSAYGVKVVLEDQYSPSVLTAYEQAKLLPWEDWLAGEHCLAFTSAFLGIAFLYSWSLQFHKQGYSLYLSMKGKTFFFRPISKSHNCMFTLLYPESNYPVLTAGVHCQYQTCWKSSVLHVGADIGVILPCCGRSLALDAPPSWGLIGIWAVV